MKYKDNWNFLDRTIYKIEELINKVVLYAKDSKEIPDPEEMILAATQHLQKENEQLKEYRIPGRVIIYEDNYQCPKCKEVIDNELFEKHKVKYCPECGKRFFKFNKSEKSTKRNSVEAKVSELL